MICLYWPFLRVDLPPPRPWEYLGSCFSALSCPEKKTKKLNKMKFWSILRILRERAERAALRSEPERWRLRALDKLGITEPKIKSPLNSNPNSGQEFWIELSRYHYPNSLSKGTKNLDFVCQLLKSKINVFFVTFQESVPSCSWTWCCLLPAASKLLSARWGLQAQTPDHKKIFK